MLLVWLILRKVSWPILTQILGALDIRWAIAGTISTLLLIAGLALRWQMFLKQQRIELPYPTTFLLTWAGQFFNSILPGSTGGDVMKVVQICRLAPDRKAAAASTVLVDRFTALVALLALVAVSLFRDPRPLTLLPLPALHTRNILTGVFVVFAVFAAVGIGLYLVRHTTVYSRVGRTIKAARDGLRLNSRLVACLALAFAVHLLNFFTVYLFARALNIPITYGQIVLMMPVVLFCVMAPVTINGHGLREVLLIGYFGLMGIVIGHQNANDYRETAIALSLVLVANDLCWSVPGGLWYLLRFKESAPQAAYTG